MKYVCDVCGWEYDEEQGYPEGCLLYTSKAQHGGSGHQQHDLRRGLFPVAHFSSPFPIFCPHYSAGELKSLLRTKTCLLYTSSAACD